MKDEYKNVLLIFRRQIQSFCQRFQETLLTNIEAWLKSFKSKSRDRRFAIYLNPKSYQYLVDTKHSELKGFMWKNWLLIELKIDENLSPHEFKVFSKRRKKFVTEEV